MAQDGRVYDGHSALFGQNNADDPSSLNPGMAAKAVNRVFRGGRNRTRPPFAHKDFVFDGVAAEYEEIVRHGNFQGWMQYRKKKAGRKDGFVVSIAGHIFFMSLVNERVHVNYIFGGNDPKLMHTWFVQAEEWVYVQNGKDLPIFWDGLTPSTARRANPDESEMPIGTIMAYCHGRVFVSNAFDEIAASDIVYGTGLTRSDQTQKFTENEYWAEGGNFGMPTDLGHITGMIVVARQNQKNSTQGELLILAEEGAASIEASVSRLLWKDTQIQTVTLTGRGCAAPATCINVNNDVMFLSDDGLSLYSMARQDLGGKLSFGKLSRHVNLWMQQSTPWLLQFASSTYFDNRVLTTVTPAISAPSDSSHGSHRYHRGIVALDLDQASDVQGDASFNWDGLWTGIRPCGLLKVRKQCLAFSYDSDGENRIYEICRDGLNDSINGKAVQTEWFYLTKRFDWRDTGRTNVFEVKKLVGGEVWISDIRDRIEIGADFRPDNCPCWYFAMRPQDFGSNFGDDWEFSQPRYKRFKFTNPDDTQECGLPYPVNHGSQHQVMVYGKGAVQVDRMRVAMAATNDPNSPVGDCESDNPKIRIDCVLENDYSYDIASR